MSAGTGEPSSCVAVAVAGGGASASASRVHAGAGGSARAPCVCERSRAHSAACYRSDRLTLVTRHSTSSCSRSLAIHDYDYDYDSLNASAVRLARTLLHSPDSARREAQVSAARVACAAVFARAPPLPLHCARPSLFFPSLPFPSLPFPSLPFPSVRDNRAPHWQHDNHCRARRVLLQFCA